MKHVNVALFVPHQGCPHQCSFCNQKSISGQREPLTREEVEQTLETARRSLGAAGRQAQIAFFGGSFTAIPEREQTALLAAVQPYLERGQFGGVRISTRPDAVSESILQRLKEFHVTAVELGAQSMDEGVLLKNRRGHTARQVEEACRLIREAGLELGLQMMTGLPGDTEEKALETARRLIACQPDTVRIYPTIVLEHTCLERWFRTGEYIPQSLEEAVSLCARMLEEFQHAGIPVIRLGLHSGGNVEEGMTAGPYHPAFRQLCESRIYLEKMRGVLHQSGVSKGACALRVCARELSTAMGQKKSNLQALQQEGYQVRLIPDDTLEPYTLQIEEGA